MQRFILEQNISRFRQRLSAASEAERGQLQRMLSAAERELALAEAAMSGLPDRAGEADAAERAKILQRFGDRFAADPTPSLLLDPAPGLLVVEANPAYEAASGLARRRLIGQPLFLLFPDNPDDPTADGVSRLYASLRAAATNGGTQAMGLQRYDLRGADGRFAERWWRPTNLALRDSRGRLAYLLHQARDATAEVLGTAAGARPG